MEWLVGLAGAEALGGGRVGWGPLAWLATGTGRTGLAGNTVGVAGSAAGDAAGAGCTGGSSSLCRRDAVTGTRSGVERSAGIPWWSKREYSKKSKSKNKVVSTARAVFNSKAGMHRCRR